MPALAARFALGWVRDKSRFFMRKINVGKPSQGKHPGVLCHKIGPRLQTCIKKINVAGMADSFRQVLSAMRMGAAKLPSAQLIIALAEESRLRFNLLVFKRREREHHLKRRTRRILAADDAVK